MLHAVLRETMYCTTSSVGSLAIEQRTFCRPIGELHGASPISKESISQSILKLFQQRIHFNHLCFTVPFKIFPTPFLFVLMDILANFYIKINSRSIQKVRFHKLFPIFRALMIHIMINAHANYNAIIIRFP